MKNILLGLFSMQNFQNIFYIFNYCNILQKQMKTPKSDSSKILKKLFVIKNLSRLFRRWKIIFSFNEKKNLFSKIISWPKLFSKFNSNLYNYLINLLKEFIT